MSDTSTGQDRRTVRRVLVVDARPVMLIGMRALALGHEDLDIVGVATSLTDARRLLGALSYDVALIALELPDGSGLDLVREAGDGAKTLLLTDRLGSRVRAAVEAAHGAEHVISTLDSPDALLGAIRRLGDRTDDERSRAAALVSTLTPRQLQIARLVEQGRSNGQIAWTLGISPKTVETHLTAIYDHCGVQGRIELLHLVQRAGLAVPPDDEVRRSDPI